MDTPQRLIKIENTIALFKGNLFYTTVDEEPENFEEIEDLPASFLEITQEDQENLDAFEIDDFQPKYDINQVQIIQEKISTQNINEIEKTIKEYIEPLEKVPESNYTWSKRDIWLYEKLKEIIDLVEKGKEEALEFSFRTKKDLRYIRELTTDYVIFDATIYYLKPTGLEDDVFFPKDEK